MTDDPVLDVHQAPNQQPVASLDAVTTLVHSFGMMIQGMEARLKERIDENAAASKERWQHWEADFRDYRATTDRRIATLEESVHVHHAEADRRRIANDARVRPVQSALSWIWINKRDILILALAVLTLLGIGDLIMVHR